MSTTADGAAADAAETPAFSLELSQDQRDIRDWVRSFAANVLRPRRHEWDEREGTPWPVIQEAAKIYTIFEGTSEIQRLVIARAISGRQIA